MNETPKLSCEMLFFSNERFSWASSVRSKSLSCASFTLDSDVRGADHHGLSFVLIIANRARMALRSFLEILIW